jgi:hypothetical protein
MIICPLNGGECNRPIPPKVRTAFIMAPSFKNQTDEARTVLHEIVKALSDLHYKSIEGSKMVRHGDFFCTICRTTQGCALGIAMVYADLPVRTISNIYLETGLMQGFGKPVILFVDKRTNLASDYIRHYAISFKSKQYLSKYRSLLEDIGKLPQDLYEHLGGFALRVGDYEKAAKYCQEAYLISPRKETLVKLKSIASTLDKSKNIPGTYKERLLENIQYFCSSVQ